MNIVLRVGVDISDSLESNLSFREANFLNAFAAKTRRSLIVLLAFIINQ